MEITIFIVHCHYYLRTHILSVSLISRSQATAILQFLSWLDDNMTLLRDGSSDSP